MKAGRNSILITALPLFSAAAVVVSGILYNSEVVGLIKIVILTLILSAAGVLYIRMNEAAILMKKHARVMILLSYLGSISLLLLIPSSELYCFWMLGGLFLAMAIDSRLGLLLHFTMSFILMLARPLKPEIVIQILFLGILIYMLSGALKEKATAVYAMIIILSTDITLSFVINNFVVTSKETYNYFHSLISILIVMVAAYFLSRFYNAGQTVSGETVLQPSAMQKAEAGEISATQLSQAPSDNIWTSSEKNESQKITGAYSSYDILCMKDNELMRQLKDYSDNLYNHAIRIAELSQRAAREVGADEQLAMAGGLYHEIGKIRGKNYIEEGLAIAEDYAFPKGLRAIIKEHNIKYDKPSSMEAAIVMLSDNVVSTIEYIARDGDHKYSAEKIIENIFQMRMEKGAFDGINLTLRDFKLLKEFFRQEFCTDIME